MKKLALVFLLFTFSFSLPAQHEHHQQPSKDTSGTGRKENMPMGTPPMRSNHPMDSTRTPSGKEHEGMNQAMEMPMDSSMMPMRNPFSKNLPMSRTGSGTSWHPENSPMYMKMYNPKGWNVMLMYGLFLRYSNQNFNHSDKRGDAQFSAPNFVMAMASHLVGKHGLISLQGMVSLDPLTVGGAGYPLLFQTGETWKGNPLVDHQHPHDLLSALAIGYTYEFNRHTDAYIYVGYPGEPALGPPTFMHRPSGLNMPSAPIGHHWQDATHITFGVTTVGFRYKNVKLEGSLFTGQEPNENRYSFDQPRFDSYGMRLSVNPVPSLALQASYGSLKNPEPSEPNTDQQRITASALHNARWNDGKVILSSALVYGMNRATTAGQPEKEYSNSYLLESNLQTNQFNLFARLESVQKSSGELQLDSPAVSPFPSETNHHNNWITSFTLGVSKYLVKTDAAWVDLGVTGSVYAPDELLESYYGNSPASFEIFLRMVPPRMTMHSMHH